MSKKNKRKSQISIKAIKGRNSRLSKQRKNQTTPQESKQVVRKSIHNNISIPVATNTSNWFQKESSIHSQKGTTRAPYNFVPFLQNDNEIFKIDEFTRRNELDDELLSGHINYTIKAETPIFVGDANDTEFYCDAYGQYAIPGSSIRGIIRENAQILGHSEPSEDIDDYRLMYRDIASGASRNTYRMKLGIKQEKVGKDKYGKDINHTILKNVLAGYIKCENGTYKIYPAKAEYKRQQDLMTYYVMNERTILKQENINQFRDIINDLQALHGYKRNGNAWIPTEENRNYKPMYRKISYESKNHIITAIARPGKLSSQGTVLLSGPMKQKKAVYLIPEEDPSQEAMIIPKEDIRAFQIDYNKREKTFPKKEFRDFFNLPKNNESKPVFYFENSGHIYFGFTPYLRIFYDHSIKDGIHTNETTCDYVKNMFGCSNDEYSYKSKLSFSDAKIQSGELCDSEIKLPLLEPKPTDYLSYLVQNNDNPKSAQTYNTERFSLRGYKQYWLKEKAILPTNEKEGNFYTTIKPLGPGTIFQGTVYYKNLKEDELGLLLWAMTIGKKAYLNIGKGKPFGYGKVKLSIQKVEKIDNEKAYDLTSLSTKPFVQLNVNDEIEIYKTKLKEYFGRSLRNDDGINALIKMKTNQPQMQITTYMDVTEKKTRPLPKVTEITKKVR